jgi:hypothetical protein
MAAAIAFNGAPGAYLRIPFPVWIRSAFGYHGAKFPVICRMVTALFWHSIQIYTGSLAMTVMLTAIWPSYADIPNRLPEGAGITSSGMLSHLLFWSEQLPFLLIRPHKLKWFSSSKRSSQSPQLLERLSQSARWLEAVVAFGTNSLDCKVALALGSLSPHSLLRQEAGMSH